MGDIMVSLKAALLSPCRSETLELANEEHRRQCHRTLLFHKTDFHTDSRQLSAQGYAPVPEFYTGAWANVSDLY